MHKRESYGVQLRSAWRLSKHSLRLRAMLLVLEANSHRPIREEHPLRLLPNLMAEVRERLETLPIHDEGVPDGTPEPASYREAVRYLAHRNYLLSPRYRRKLWSQDVRQLKPELSEFADEFRKHMARLGVPVYADICSRAGEHRAYVTGRIAKPGPECLYMEGRAVSLVHAVRGRNVNTLCWQVFEHCGLEVAGKLCLGVQWGGVSAPWLWRL